MDSDSEEEDDTDTAMGMREIAKAPTIHHAIWRLDLCRRCKGDRYEPDGACPTCGSEIHDMGPVRCKRCGGSGSDTIRMIS